MGGLVLFAIGFAVSCGICSLGISLGWIVFLMALGGAGFCLAICCRKKLSWLGITAVICAGLTLGGGWYLIYRAAYLNAALEMDGRTQTVTIQASDYSDSTGFGGAVDGWVTLEGKPYQVRAYLDENKALSPGDAITGAFRFRATTAGGQEDATYHQGNGIFLIAYQEGTVSHQYCEKAPWWCFPAVLRSEIKAILASCFSGDDYAFAKALLLGDSTDLSYEVNTDFKLSGIRHIIAVSGLHVSILYGMLSTLTGKRRFLSAVVGLPVLVLFAAVAGFTPSVTRACIMVGLMIAAMAFNREYDPKTALGFATVVMLVVNPQSITSVGLQLSVGSVAGIFLFSEPIAGAILSRIGGEKGILGKLGRWVASTVGVSLSATLITAPLSAWYFGAVSLVAVVTNLLTLWVVSFIFYGIMAVCLLGAFWIPGAAFLGKLVALPIRYVLAAAGLMADFPLAAVYTRSTYITAWLVFVYLLLIVYLILPKKRTGLLCGCAALGLCLALIAGWVEPLLDECRVTVLDVGQGQSILLQSEGKTFLVDCGGDSDTNTADIAAETLLTQGIRKLDGIIVTHYDRDHSGALGNLLTRLDTDLLILPVDNEDGEGSILAAETGGTVVFVEDELQVSFGVAALTVYGSVFASDSNENSLCILFRTESCDILITGDRSASGERSLLRQAELPEVEVLIVGHHGSKYSTCSDLLDAVRPEIAIISVGADNFYGHPAQEVLDRLAEYGCQVYRTDMDGTVIFRR